MVCPDCGADHHLEECPQPGAVAPIRLPLSESEPTLDPEVLDCMPIDETVSTVAPATSRLIEFPGVTRRTVPPWRKELTERVKEVQERRAHEAAAGVETMQGAEAANMRPPQLELLPQVEAADVNPLVVAALKRIERAHQPSEQVLRSSNPATLSAAVLGTEQVINRNDTRQENGNSRRAVGAMMFDDCRNETHTAGVQSPATQNLETAVSVACANEMLPPGEIACAPERTVNLVVVPPAAIVAETNPSVVAVAAPEVAPAKPKPRRVISDEATDPALNYLDLVGVACPLDVDPEKRAPLFSRLIAGVIDLLSVGFLSVPFAAVIELRNDNWREPRVAAFMAAGAVVVMFVYLTVSTALTGKTLGMRILSLRVIDTRTRMIPTGQQAAGRAIVYILSLLTAGLGFLMALARGEGKTVHDRLSRTAVVRD